MNNRHPLITEFLEHGRADRAYSDHTLRSYRSALNAFALVTPDLLAVSAADLIAYDQTHARTLRPRSRARNVCALRALYLWLYAERKLIARNPSEKLHPPTLDRSTRSCPSPETREKLIEGCDRLKTDRKAIFARALLGCMFYAALRPEEVCKLQLDDVVLQARNSFLIIQKGKGRRRREVPLADDLVAWLRAWLAVRNVVEDTRPSRAKRKPEENPAFFVHGPTKMSVTQYFLRVVLSEVKRVAGVVDDNLTPHSLRHSCATTLYEQGADLPVIQEVLGHKSLETTRAYVHPTDNRKFAAVQRLNRNAPRPAPVVKEQPPVQRGAAARIIDREVSAGGVKRSAWRRTA